MFLSEVLESFTETAVYLLIHRNVRVSNKLLNRNLTPKCIIAKLEKEKCCSFKNKFSKMVYSNYLSVTN